jgi:hypothetical protein
MSKYLKRFAKFDILKNTSLNSELKENESIFMKVTVDD